MVAGIKPWVSPTSVACGSKGKKRIYRWTLTYEQSVLTRTPHTNELWLYIKLTNTSLELANVWAVIINVISFFLKKSVQLPTIRLTNTFTGTHYVPGVHLYFTNRSHFWLSIWDSELHSTDAGQSFQYWQWYYVLTYLLPLLSSDPIVFNFQQTWNAQIRPDHVSCIGRWSLL